MISKFANGVRIVTALLVTTLIATGCSKSSSDNVTTVFVDQATPADNVTADNASEASDTASSTTDGGGSSNESAGDTLSPDEETLEPVEAAFDLVADKTFRISWKPAQGAQFYRVLENSDGLSGFVQISDDLDVSTQVFDHRVALYKKVNARYIVQACSANSCIDSEELIVSDSLADAIVYFKASNADQGDFFGASVALNSDGTVLAVSAYLEESADSGVNANQDDNSMEYAGAVYVFARSNNRWLQQAYIKSSNTEQSGFFGVSISLSSDGQTLAVGAISENSAATGINGDQSNNSATNSGAAYVFTNIGGNWQQQAYLKASNAGAYDQFGADVSLSGDGKTLVVSATSEDSNATVINGDESNNLAPDAGAVYVFSNANTIDGTSGNWEQEAYLKASNAEEDDSFGSDLGLSADGNVLAVGAYTESSAADGVNSDQNNNSADGAGAVYIFERINGSWQQQSYLKADNSGVNDRFGWHLSLSDDGETLAVTAVREDSAMLGVNGNQTNKIAESSGAVYVFEMNSTKWQQVAYIKASNREASDVFGTAISLSGDGNTMVVGASQESSSAVGINGDQYDNASIRSGAAYVFERINGSWQQQAYLKASNTSAGSGFGSSASLSKDGDTLAIGAFIENNRATGINSNQSGGILESSGAVYLY